jgi:hypothetical protein
MIKDGTVFNIAEWDGQTDWNPDCDIVECPDEYTGGINWKWDGNKFIAPVVTDAD